MIKLDDQQQTAVETDAGKVLVIAGAGSGKTRVLTERIAHLIEEKRVSPYDITAFTFTRKAAREMRDRLEFRLSGSFMPETIESLNIGTMHSVALDAIKRFGEYLGYKTGNLTVFGDWEFEFLLKEVAREVGVYDKKWKIPKKEIDRVFQEYFTIGVKPPETAKSGIKALFARMNDRLKAYNALSFGDILIKYLELLKHPGLSQNLAICLKPQHLLVDEVQDCDNIQWEIIHTMVAQGAQIFMVGDFNQSIYSFRGADPSRIDILDQTLGDVTIYNLFTNYRSAPEVISYANALIRNNPQGTHYKDMAPGSIVKGNIEVIENQDSDAAVGRITSRFIISTHPLAVMARNHGFLKKISRLLDEKEVPHHYVGKQTSKYKTDGFRKIIAILRLWVNPHDTFSFLLLRESLGLSPRDYADLIYLSSECGKSPYMILEELGDLPEWVEKTSKIKAILKEPIHVDDFLNIFSPQISLLESITQDDIDNFESLFDFDTLDIFLKWFALIEVQDEIIEDHQEQITLITIHAAKGLEWPEVMVVGCNEGILPSKQAKTFDEIQEERRVAYVAWTRAENKLSLGVRPDSDPSRFIGESIKAEEVKP